MSIVDALFFKTTNASKEEKKLHSGVVGPVGTCFSTCFPQNHETVLGIAFPLCSPTCPCVPQSYENFRVQLRNLDTSEMITQQ